MLPLWIASVAVLLNALEGREPLGAQATIAAFLVVALPVLMLRGRIKEV